MPWKIALMASSDTHSQMVANRSSLSSKYWKREPLAICASLSITLRLPAEKPRSPNSAIAASTTRRRLSAGRFHQVALGTPVLGLAEILDRFDRSTAPGPTVAGRCQHFDLDLGSLEEPTYLGQGGFLPLVEGFGDLGKAAGLLAHLILDERQGAQAAQGQAADSTRNEVGRLKDDVVLVAHAQVADDHGDQAGNRQEDGSRS